MAFLDHIDPGNSGGSVPTPESRFKYVQKTAAYHCPLCDAIFPTDADMRQHKAAIHPTKRPYLYIRGQALGNTEHIVRNKLIGSDISLEDVDLVKIDSKSFSDPELAIEYLLTNQRGSRHIVLTHQSYEVVCRLLFDIADEEALEEIDKLFYDVFSSKIPMAKQLELFNDKARLIKGNGLSYAGALGCYITAVMAKDRASEVSIPFSEYVNKLGEAHDKLQGIARPLSESIQSIILFMLNDFLPSKGDENTPQLKATKECFRSGTFITVQDISKRNRRIPIDAITEQIISFCSASEIYRKAAVTSLAQIESTPVTSMQDRSKLAFLLYVSARLNGELRLEAKYRKQLQHSKIFEVVLSQLEETKK